MKKIEKNHPVRSKRGIKVTTREVHLHAFSVPGYPLPTFSTGRLKTVKWLWFTIVRYLMFEYITNLHEVEFNRTTHFNYTKTYIRIK